MLLAGACISDRYVGSIGRTGSYSNRGYGLTIDLAQGGLSRRWKTIDPSMAQSAPLDLAPDIIDAALDLDGDGRLELDEHARWLKPTLRVVSKTATTTRIDVEVSILGGNNRKHKLDDLMASEIKSLTGGAPPIGRVEHRKVGPDFSARIAELPSNAFHAHRLALIDHDHFEAEEGIDRRQIVRVVLVTPTLTSTTRADFNRFLAAISLNAMGGRQTKREKF